MATLLSLKTAKEYISQSLISMSSIMIGYTIEKYSASSRVLSYTYVMYDSKSILTFVCTTISQRLIAALSNFESEVPNRLRLKQGRTTWLGNG